jgi:hypothetical protein
VQPPATASRMPVSARMFTTRVRVCSRSSLRSGRYSRGRVPVVEADAGLVCSSL